MRKISARAFFFVVRSGKGSGAETTAEIGICGEKKGCKKNARKGSGMKLTSGPRHFVQWTAFWGKNGPTRGAY